MAWVEIRDTEHHSLLGKYDPIRDLFERWISIYLQIERCRRPIKHIEDLSRHRGALGMVEIRDSSYNKLLAKFYPESNTIEIWDHVYVREAGRKCDIKHIEHLDRHKSPLKDDFSIKDTTP